MDSSVKSDTLLPELSGRLSMDFLGDPDLRHVWSFVLGHSTRRDFEQWVCSAPGLAARFGEALYADLISADYRDLVAVGELRVRLFEWAEPLTPPLWRRLPLGQMPYLTLRDNSIRRLLPMGYWYSVHEPELPHPKDHVDPSWDEGARHQVIEYLESAYVLCGSMGYSWCRICFASEEEAVRPGRALPPIGLLDMGNRDLTDGTWVFPEGLAHYLKHHFVRPGEAFLEHVRLAGYRVPDLTDVVSAEFSKLRRNDRASR